MKYDCNNNGKRERGEQYRRSKYTYQENDIALDYTLNICTAFLATQNHKDWQTGENSGKTTDTAIKIQILRTAELHLIIPNNIASVWGLKSKPRCK